MQIWRRRSYKRASRTDNLQKLLLCSANSRKGLSLAAMEISNVQLGCSEVSLERFLNCDSYLET